MNGYLNVVLMKSVGAFLVLNSSGPPSYWCWEPNLGLKGQQVLLNVELSLALFLAFETRSHCADIECTIAQADLELTTLIFPHP